MIPIVVYTAQHCRHNVQILDTMKVMVNTSKRETLIHEEIHSDILIFIKFTYVYESTIEALE